jgi:hypothetical protein
MIGCLLFGSSFAQEYFVAPAGNDSNPGTEASPWKSLTHAIDQLVPGDILTLREGIYRLIDEPGLGVINKDHLTIRGYPGERAQLYGSASTEGMTWEAYSATVWRIPAGFLQRDPKGMFNKHVRVEHQSDLDGGRDHDFVHNLVIPNTWTKADVNGDQCFSDNDGCYLYLYPAIGENPNQQVYELSQRSLGRVAGNGDYMRLENLEFYYTQSSPIFFEGADFVTLKNNVFAHVSNGNDNSYAVRIWDSQGSVVTGNTVYDSQYWGGVSNSKGITFMVTRPGEPNVVEYNEIYDIPGYAAVGTKGGVSNLIVRYNYIHDVYAAIDPGDFRCVWSSTNNDGCQSTDPEYRPGGGWKVYGNIITNSDTGVYLPGYREDSNNHLVYNNVFYQAKAAIRLGWNGSFGNVFANNVFSHNEAGIYLSSGGTTTSVSDYLDQYISHNNLFHNNSLADVHLRPNWGGNFYSGTPYTFLQMQDQFNSETNSIGGDPLFTSYTSFEIAANSPAVAAGDGGFWGRESVDIGAHPFYWEGLIFANGFE